MENENMTPVPEQPQYAPPAEPEYAPPAEPQFAPPAEPEYAPPAEPQFTPPAEPEYAPPAEPEYAPPAEPQFASPAEPEYAPPAEPEYQEFAQPQTAPFEEPQYPQHQEPAQPFAPFEQPQYAPFEQPTAAEPEQPKKKKKAWKIVLPIVAVVLAAAAACVYFFFLRTPSVKTVELSETSLYLKPGDDYALDFTFEPAEAKEFVPEWSSNNEAVATVEDGVIKAVGAGDCVITLRAGDSAKDDCFVTVATPPADGGEIVGTWRYDGAFIDDVYYSKADCRLTVYADNRAALVIDGEVTNLSWRFTSRVEGVDLYDLVADDGTYSEFWYYAESGGDYAGKLVLYGNDENMFIFKK